MTKSVSLGLAKDSGLNYAQKLRVLAVSGCPVVLSPENIRDIAQFIDKGAVAQVELDVANERLDALEKDLLFARMICRRIVWSVSLFWLLVSVMAYVSGVGL